MLVLEAEIILKAFMNLGHIYSSFIFRKQRIALRPFLTNLSRTIVSGS